MEFIVPTEADKSREAIAESIEKLTSQITLGVDQLKIAIEAASSPNCREKAASLGACLTALLTIGLLFYELTKWRQERNRTLGLDLLRQIKEQHQNVITTLAPSSQITNNREAWQSVYDQLKCLKPVDQIKDEAIKKEAEQHRTQFKEDLKMYLRDSDPEKESLRWQFFTGYEYWEGCEGNWKALKPKVTMYSTRSEPDKFGNSTKTYFTNICPNVAVAIFHYAHEEDIPLLENIKIEASPDFNSDDVIGPKKLTEMIKCNINSKVPDWSHDLKMQPPTGLLYFLGCYYKNSNKTDN
ncbi:hypothetical protein [Marinomonas fungiae]|uniref:hypothetical protein n=1 Tax=Marinomonas fungiae TaxID=1137284 RepID=UPI003A93D457